MTKIEMESHQAEYDALVSNAHRALQQGLYGEGVRLAISSWDYIDGMMQYERKYEEREFHSIETIDIVLHFAPLLFDFESLDKLELRLKSQRRIEKNTSEDLGQNLAKARALLWDAHRLWNHLERQSECRQDELRRTLGGDQDRWRSMAESWERMGLIRRTPEAGSYRLALSTRMDAPFSAKCPSCGAVGKAPKRKLLEELACPKCRAKVLFVFISREHARNA